MLFQKSITVRRQADSAYRKKDRKLSGLVVQTCSVGTSVPEGGAAQARWRLGVAGAQDSLLSEMSEAQMDEVALEMSRVSESDFDLWTTAMKESDVVG